MCFIVIHVENYLHLKSTWIIKKKMHNRHRPKHEKQEIDQSTGDKN